MNKIPLELIKKANNEAILNTYLYLADKSIPKENKSLKTIVSDLENAYLNEKTVPWKKRDIQRLNIIKNAVSDNEFLSDSKLINFTYSKSGLTACCFDNPDNTISVVFKGTGDGEWIDNGEGLSGIPEENTYITYAKDGKAENFITLKNDYATDQQTEALNWFNKKASENSWGIYSKITVSGHSKGGNKAQFITMNSDIIKLCFSFNGQGFSPEALDSFKENLNIDYEKRRYKVFGFSACNDYVNALGKRLVPFENTYYFESFRGLHNIEAILDDKGNLRPLCKQGILSGYIESVSDEIMSLPPTLRQHATLGIMNIFQKYLGEGEPVNGDNVSVKKTLSGLTIALASFLYRLKKI